MYQWRKPALLIFFASNTEAQPSLVEFEATFQRVNVFRGGLNECPETIQLTDLADVSSSLLVPISSVLFDGEVCPRDDDLNLVDNPILRTNLQFFESTNVNVTGKEDRCQNNAFVQRLIAFPRAAEHRLTLLWLFGFHARHFCGCLLINSEQRSSSSFQCTEFCD